MDLHDATLYSLIFEWNTARATLTFRQHGTTHITMVAEEVRELALSHRLEWGPSVSVNAVTGPVNRAAEEKFVEIEMQTGDKICIVAHSFTTTISA